MRAYSKKIILAGITFSAFLSTGALACTVPATVTDIYDGDSVSVIDSGKQNYQIRLLAADAPQLGQPYSIEAKEYLKSLIGDKSVCLEPIETDDKGRVVARVKLDDKDIGFAMIKAGYAWYDTFYGNQQSATEQQLYSDAELDAGVLAIGLWAKPSPIPPWDWTLLPEQ